MKIYVLEALRNPFMKNLLRDISICLDFLIVNFLHGIKSKRDEMS